MTLVAVTGLAYRLNVVSLGRFAALALLCSGSSEKGGPRWPAALPGSCEQRHRAQGALLHVRVAL